jgi:hypothetical protein
MRKSILTGFLFVVILTVQAQSDIKKIINDGIALHDKGDYEGALAKYNEARQADSFDCTGTIRHVTYL